MADTIPGELPALLTALTRAQRAFTKARDNLEAAKEAVVWQGFSAEAVDLALRILDGDAEHSFETMLQAGQILEQGKSPVRVEMVSLSENAGGVADMGAVDRAYEAGLSARSVGERCHSPYMPGVLHDAWVKGWSEGKS